MSDRDFEFTNDIRGALHNEGIRGAWTLLFIIVLLLVAAIAWASWATVSQSAVGAGRVIPSSQIQVVDNLEPGFVREIHVAEGDEVEQGQLLIRLDETSSGARLGELARKQTAFTAELARLEAQAAFIETVPVEPSWSPEIRAAYDDQQQVLTVELGKLAEQLTIRRQQLEQKKQALNEAEATQRKQNAALALAQRELDLTSNLFKRRAVPEIEYLKIQRAAAELRGEVEIIASSILRLQAELNEARALVDAERSAFRATTLERRARVSAELAVISESMKAAKDTVRRTELRAPVSGIVNLLNVASVGEVVQSGTTIAEIVPLDDRLLIEAKITPKDVAFVRPGLKARIRLTAYDYTRFGTFEGVVERIGADTITDENQETFYRVIVATDEDSGIPNEVKIIPGMIATVDVETGNRTVLEYLLKPVLRIRDTALREPT
ncbi:MAG: HlyD family type I secretion periplasmic adaptor subunit, partial [Pseudomonadota bacterium]